MDPFIGMIIMFAGSFVPRGWAPCDGRKLAVREYEALFSLLGDRFGGDGRETFALPDLRGRLVGARRKRRDDSRTESDCCSYLIALEGRFPTEG